LYTGDVALVRVRGAKKKRETRRRRRRRNERQGAEGDEE
jgi:hypothetical protein